MSVNFARKATGLVRQAGAKDIFIYNINFINIAIGVMFMLEMMPDGAYPGINIYLATIICTLVVLPTALVYAMFATAMPRSGGDYVYVSRAITPAFGFAANWNYTVWSFFYIGVPAAFFGRYGMSAVFRELGVNLGSPNLIAIGNWFSTPLATALTGTVLIAIFSGIFIVGVNTYMKVQNIIFYVASIGLAITAFVLLKDTPAQSIAHFNSYTHIFTGESDTYNKIISSLGSGAVHHDQFSWNSTLISMTWPFTVLGYSIASAYIGGEIKGANRAQLIGMPGALVYSAAWILLLSWATIHAFGIDFLGNLGAVNPSSVNLTFLPSFAELAVMLTKNIWLVIIIGVSFLLWTYTWMPIYILTATRNILAWSLDGLMPQKLSEVSDRHHSPVIAIVVSSALGVVSLWIYAYDTSFTVLSGFFGQVVGTFLLTSVGAILFPFTQKDIFEASPIAWRIGRIPVISAIGVLSFFGMSTIVWAYLNDPQSGISFSTPYMLYVNLGIAASGFAVYWAVRLIRAKQGVDVTLAFKEIPPE